MASAPSMTNVSPMAGRRESVPIGQFLKLYHVPFEDWSSETSEDSEDLAEAGDNSPSDAKGCRTYFDIDIEDKAREIFLAAHQDTQCGSKTFGEIASYVEEITHPKGVVFPIPSYLRLGQYSQPRSIQVTGGGKKDVIPHQPAMTSALLRPSSFAVALISSMHALNRNPIQLSRTERDTAISMIDDELKFPAKYGPEPCHWGSDLENIKRELEVNYRPKGDQEGILSVYLACLPNLVEGKAITEHEGSRRFIETLSGNPSYKEWMFNNFLCQAATRGTLPLQQQTALMPPGLVDDLNQFVAPKEYDWSTTNPDAKILPRPSELIYLKDPWIKEYRNHTRHPQMLVGLEPWVLEGTVRSADLLSQLRTFLEDGDTDSFKEASRDRVCAVYNTSDPGPTVAEYYRSQDPYDYALNHLKEDFENRGNDSDDPDATEPPLQIDFDDPNAIEPLLPQPALAIHRQRQGIRPSMT